MTPADKPELVAGYYRCTESRTKLFTVGTAYEVYRYEPDGRATVITNLDTDVTLPHPEATLEPYDPWGRPTKPARLTSDLAERIEGLVEAAKYCADELEAFARHREYGYHQGYYDGRTMTEAETVAKIVAWLNDYDPTFADAIETGEWKE